MRRKLLYGLTLLLASASVVGLAACGDKKTTTEADTTTNQNTTTNQDTTTNQGTTTNQDTTTQTPGPTVCKGTAEELANMKVDTVNLVPKKTVIKLYADNGDAYANQLAAQFQAAHPEYIVEVSKVGAPDVRARMELEGADGADVFVFPHDHVGPALASNLLAKAPTDVADGFKETLKASTLDTIRSCWDDATGKQKKCTETDEKYVFGAPLSAESNALFYNKALVQQILLNEAGEDGTTPFTAEVWASIPEETKTKWENVAADLKGNNLSTLMTLDDMLEVAKYYNSVESGNSRYFYQADFDDFYHSYMYLTPFGYDLFGEGGDDKTLDNLNSEPVLKALAYVQDKFGINSAKPWYPGADAIVQDTYMEEFYSGKAPIVVTGPWNASNMYKNFAVGEGDNITYPNLGGCGMPDVVIDGVRKPSTTFSGVLVIGVSKLSKVTGDAWKLAQFMVSEEGASILYSTSGKLPCLKDVNGIEGIKDDIVLNAVSAQLTNSKGMPSISEMGYMWTIGTTLFVDTFTNIAPAEAAKKAHDSYVAQAGIGA